MSARGLVVAGSVTVACVAAWLWKRWHDADEHVWHEPPSPGNSDINIPHSKDTDLPVATTGHDVKRTDSVLWPSRFTQVSFWPVGGHGTSPGWHKGTLEITPGGETLLNGALIDLTGGRNIVVPLKWAEQDPFKRRCYQYARDPETGGIRCTYYTYASRMALTEAHATETATATATATNGTATTHEMPQDVVTGTEVVQTPSPTLARTPESPKKDARPRSGSVDSNGSGIPDESFRTLGRVIDQRDRAASLASSRSSLSKSQGSLPSIVEGSAADDDDEIEVPLHRPGTGSGSLILERPGSPSAAVY